jgi:DNA-3-methyladenine glycosylase
MRQLRGTESRTADFGRPLGREFYARGVRVLARDVLGRLLIHDSAEGPVAGRIVEVEAYGGDDDPASHAYRGPTPRNRVMFGPPGHAYIYFIYGMHHCLNLVARRDGVAAAVLIRAIEPCCGEEIMRARRGSANGRGLASGPGSVARALGLTRDQDGVDLVRGPLWISDQPPVRGRRVVVSPRIGIRVGQERLWRYFLNGHPCVSGPRRGQPGRTPWLTRSGPSL